MDRREFVASVGVTASVAGCLDLGGGGSNGDGGGGSGVTASADCGDGDPLDGCPSPDDVDGPTSVDPVDTGSFDAVEEGGVEVPLVPIDVAYDWFRARAVRFADARSATSYQRAHVLGAVSSPAGAGPGYDHPTADWPTEDFVITYCTCPHHLSSIRAAELIDAGHENVFALDEGFGVWFDREYPMAGQRLTAQPQQRVIEGRTDPADAGGDAWAWHDPTGQREAGPIGDDGRYELPLRFSAVTEDSVVRVETPSYTVEGRLGELTSATVRPADGDRA
jgi:rhodanese-related sulfurtransferase